MAWRSPELLWQTGYPEFRSVFLPMYEYFHRKLLERGFAMADETPLQVLHEPERRAQTKSYMWLFRSGEDGETTYYPL